MLLKAFNGHSLQEIMQRDEAEAQQLVKAIEPEMPWGQAVYRAWCDLGAKYGELLPFIHGIPGVNPVTFADNLIEHLQPHVGELGPLSETSADEMTKAVDRVFFEEQRTQGNIILGYAEVIPNMPNTTPRPIVISPDALTRHGYLRGKTGAGKSTALQFRLTQMFNIPSRGAIVISPERGLFKNRLLPYIPTERFSDIL
jgi:hypothetical protein